MRVLTLYKTPSPGISIKSGEFYELAPNDPDGRGFTLNEFHGNWDGVKGEKHSAVLPRFLVPLVAIPLWKRASPPSTSGKCFERNRVSFTASDPPSISRQWPRMMSMNLSM
jgi:hypothetical protein